MAQETLVAAYRDGTLYSFIQSQEHTYSRFGGPLDWSLTGVKHGPATLHQVARFGGAELRELRRKGDDICIFSDVALFYGFQFDGCALSYRVEELTSARILSLSPKKSSEDCPYRGFPQLVPCVPLKLGRKRRLKYATLAEMVPNLAEKQPAELMFFVRPVQTIGISLWG